MSITRDFRVAVFCGENVGKSAILEKFGNHEINPHYMEKIGIDFFNHTINIEDIKVRLQLFDLSGDPRFSSHIPFRNGIETSSGFVLVYDITNSNSFERIQFMYDRFKSIVGITTNCRM